MGPTTAAPADVNTLSWVPEARPLPDDFLEMPQEQGHMRFGPLPDVVRIGSDERQCDVILAPRTGVPGVALELRRTGESWSMHFPAHPPHPCQLLAPGVLPGHGRRIGDGARVQAGETLMISGMTLHPRFRLVRSGPKGLPMLPGDGGIRPGLPSDPDAALNAARRKRRWNPFRRKTAEEKEAEARLKSSYAGALGAEAKRQTESRMLARMPMVRRLRDVFWRFRRGGFGEPVMMVGLGIAVISAVAAGGISIVGILWLIGN